jgi:hypothetical protein
LRHAITPNAAKPAIISNEMKRGLIVRPAGGSEVTADCPAVTARGTDPGQPAGAKKKPAAEAGFQGKEGQVPA